MFGNGEIARSHLMGFAISGDREHKEQAAIYGNKRHSKTGRWSNPYQP
jgi:hypothetical protein